MEGAASGGNEGSPPLAQTRHRRVAVVVRTVLPCEGAVERIVRWKQASERVGAHLWVSMDTSREEEGREASVAALQAKVGDRVHQYDEAAMRQAYSVLGDMREDEAVNKAKEIQSGRFSLAWGFHMEAVNLWFQALEQQQRYDWVWVFEDDVDFCGALDWFLQQNAAREEDLLADDIKTVIACASETEKWFWADTVSPAYNSAIPMEKRFFAREHVQRFSARLLDGLHAAASKENMVAWSEQGTPTLAKHLGFSVGQIEKNLIGTPYSWDGRVTQEEWALWLAEADPSEHRNKLYHALKW
mmetsp:Transcript_12566/g.22386  ORF Transcript_12566/g.22386 Transcript_12566/m.22386 type:complete len:300 (+) Transcript_12566:258-1157(+)|eukprot:CAMPEP_0184524062 /NCGR_PEP_ID=MMETSP0198_2-20121128/9280_1 /TAXON_ID=1112570 /ORGANISM="Thraustochytrium sp., Strain LLF1b" /LENGTH=299 /DNA_ID=CAMNT_0026915261 /DNA_START=316 /DNA_END=1215 /DNA_ORIENTATION=+